MEVGDLTDGDRDKIQETLGSNSADVPALMSSVGKALSGITSGASLVLTPKSEAPIKHIEFVSLGVDRALTVLVFADGQVENRLFTPPKGHTPSSMREAANFLNSLAEGRTLSELREVILREVEKRRREVDEVARAMVESGLAVWNKDGAGTDRLIVQGGRI